MGVTIPCVKNLPATETNISFIGEIYWRNQLALKGQRDNDSERHQYGQRH